MSKGEAIGDTQAGRVVCTISRELGMARRDYLRQIIAYETPVSWWRKDNFSIREPYRAMVQAIVAELGTEDVA